MKQYIINGVIFTSVIATLISLWGLGLVFNDQFTPSHSSGQLKAKKPVSQPTHTGYQFLALGDSLTRGTGDATGKGYVGDLINKLKTETKKPVLLTNLAIKGATSTDLLKQLKQPEVQRQIQQANYIIFTIGGNDLFQGGENLTNFSIQRIHSEEKVYLAHLHEIYRILRSQNKKALIFHVGLYNPFGALSHAKQTSAVVRQWNYDAATVASKFPNIVYVPTFDLFQLHVNEYLYNDKFHPNSQGYQLIAKRLAALIHFSSKGGGKS